MTGNRKSIYKTCIEKVSLRTDKSKAGLLPRLGGQVRLCSEKQPRLLEQEVFPSWPGRSVAQVSQKFTLKMGNFYVISEKFIKSLKN